MQNLHTHTTLSDGSATPREMALEAIKRGFSSLGFSDHAKMDFSVGIEFEKEIYIPEIQRVREEFEGKLEIFIGAELDYYSKGVENPADYDYTIGSVHFVKAENGDIIEYDHSPKISLEAIQKYFGGDPYAYARAYYENVATLADGLDFDIVGHFDVVTKYAEKHGGFFDTGSPIYRNMALEALHAIREKREIFEVNSGGIGRGWRRDPYPERFLLCEMRRLDCKMVITSDCHTPDTLDCNFARSRELLSECGFTEVYRLTKSGFVGEKI